TSQNKQGKQNPVAPVAIATNVRTNAVSVKAAGATSATAIEAISRPGRVIRIKLKASKPRQRKALRRSAHQDVPATAGARASSVNAAQNPLSRRRAVMKS